MATLLTSKLLPQLIESGADAEGHLFQVSIVGLFQDNAEVMMIRADDVSIPELSSGTVDIPIFNTNVKKLANGIALDRTLSISFRLDINYEVYKRLYSKLKINDQGVVNPSDEEYKITVTAFKPTPSRTSLGSGYLESTTEWVFEQAKLYKLSGVSFSRNGSPLKITAGFIYKTVKNS